MNNSCFFCSKKRSQWHFPIFSNLFQCFQICWFSSFPVLPLFQFPQVSCPATPPWSSASAVCWTRASAPWSGRPPSWAAAVGPGGWVCEVDRKKSRRIKKSFRLTSKHSFGHFAGIYVVFGVMRRNQQGEKKQLDNKQTLKNKTNETSKSRTIWIAISLFIVVLLGRVLSPGATYGNFNHPLMVHEDVISSQGLVSFPNKNRL